MVGKKRCDFCLKIQKNNISSEEKVLERQLKDILLEIVGAEALQVKLENVLTCLECAVKLWQAEPLVKKARKLLTKQTRKAARSRNKSLTIDGDSALLDENSELKDDSQNDDENGKLPTQSPVKKLTTKPKIQARRKSVAASSMHVDSITGDGLEGNPVAYSTLAGNTSLNESEGIIKPKGKGKSDVDGKPKAVAAKGNVTPKKSLVKKTHMGDKNNESNSQKENNLETHSPHKTSPIKRDLMTSFGDDVKEEIKEPEITPFKKMKDNSVTDSPIKNSQDYQELTPNSIKHSSKRLISISSDNCGEEVEKKKEVVMPFKKMKDNASDSQEHVNSVKECLECGKTFMHIERYEAHVVSQKCRLAAFDCKHPDCSRRFFKMHKMLEHMAKKHPDMKEIDE